jgi:hypothetical protein
MAKTNVVLKSVWDDKGIKAARKEFADFGKNIGIAFAAVGAATVAGAAALVRFGSDAIAAAENVQQANNRLEQVNKSMGLFGTQTAGVTQRLIAFAEANELTVAVDAEVIKATQAKLLTFKELGQTADEAGGAFDRATMAALDLAAAGFGSAESNAIQLGKALQDPIKGLTALRRAGVTFTEAEKEKIKAMVESGQILEAQNLILGAIETQVGGTAQATAKASDVMKLAFDNVSEAVGGALLPVFKEFTDEIVKITPQLEAALAPAAAEVGEIFRTEVLPAIQDFTKWLASPDGTQTVRDLAQAIIDAIKNLVNFVGWVVKNKDAIAAFTAVVATLYIGFKAVTTATALWQAGLVLLQTQVVTATGTTTAFATALKALPWFAVAAGVTLFVGSMSDYANEVYGSKVNTEGLTEAQAAQARRVESLQKLLKQYQYALENGTEANKQLARDGIARVTAQLEAMGISAAGTRGEINRFNNIKLNGLRNEINATAGEMNRFRNIAKGFVAPNATPNVDDTFGGGGGGGASGPSAFEQVQKIIKDAQKKLGEAQKTYNDAVSRAKKDYDDTIAKATKNYSESVVKAETDRDKSLANALKQHNVNLANIQADFAKRQADIIATSINRLRDAFAASVRVNVASLFDSEDIAKSVDNLVKNLRDRLTASRQLVANAASLASGGFSQTFIEQVVGAGLEAGNELATAILTATPETQDELKSLFGALETESETGMDSLAKTMYEKTGLATTELKRLFSQTQSDLVAALAQAQIDYVEAQKTIQDSFSEAMTQAAKTRDEAFAEALTRMNETMKEAKLKYLETVQEIKDAMNEALLELEGNLGGLEGTVKKFIGLLDQILAKQQQIAGFNVGTPTIPSTTAPTIQVLPTPTQTQKPTIIINNTVKTDPTKSVSMTGAAISAAINKYIGGGGGLNRGIAAI